MYFSSNAKIVFKDKVINLDCLVGDAFDENNCLKFSCVVDIEDPFAFIGKEDIQKINGVDTPVINYDFIDGYDINESEKFVFTVETLGNWYEMEIFTKDLWFDVDWTSHDNSLFRLMVIVEDSSDIVLIPHDKNELKEKLKSDRNSWSVELEG